jgi:hypothetical protein
VLNDSCRAQLNLADQPVVAEKHDDVVGFVFLGDDEAAADHAQ